MPGVSELTAFYPDTYHSLHGDSRIQRIRNDLRIRRMRALTTGVGPILDYGCGDGSFLMQAAEACPAEFSTGTRSAGGGKSAALLTVRSRS